MKLPKVKFERMTIDGNGAVQVMISFAGYTVMLSFVWSKGMMQ